MRQTGDRSKTVVDWRIATVLLSAFLLHNMEEALTFGAYRASTQTLIRELTFRNWSVPTVDSFFVALAVVSLAATLSMIWAILRPTRRSALIFVRGLAWIMLLNVALPHVPAAIFLGGYAPGLVTAVFVNLPIACLALIRLRMVEIP